MSPRCRLTRRSFLGRTAAAALLPAAGFAASAAPSPAIDTHIHFYDPTRPQGVPWPRPDDRLLYSPHLPDRFAAATAGLDIVGAVVVEASPWPGDNEWLLELAAATPAIVGIVGNLAPGTPEFAPALRRLAAQPLFRGLRLGATALRDLSQPAVAADLGRLADADLALDLLGGPPILAPAERLARAWPNLRVVLNHLPFPVWDADVPALRAALAGVARCPNVFVKVSDVVRRIDGRTVEDPAYYRPALNALFDLFGPGRLLYGSNWPVSGRNAPYRVIHDTVAAYFRAKGPFAAERFFWRNSHAAYRWGRRGAAAALTP
jgi:L-fuconolactonase